MNTYTDEAKKHIKEDLIKDAWGKKQFGIATMFRSAKLEQFPGIVEGVLMEIVTNKLCADDEAVEIFRLFSRTLEAVHRDDRKMQVSEMLRLLSSIPENSFCGGHGSGWEVNFPKLKEQIVLAISVYYDFGTVELVRFFLSINPKYGEFGSKKYWDEIIRKSLGVTWRIKFDELILLARGSESSLMCESVVRTLSMARVKNTSAVELIKDAHSRVSFRCESELVSIGPESAACFI